MSRRVRRALLSLLVLVVLGAGVAVVGWWKLLKPGGQDFADPQARFLRGSLGAELLAGIPYPIFMILPRVFPDLIERHATRGYGPGKPGWGGYGAFGLPWEDGQRLPAGFSIQRLGTERVTVTCALCHTASYRLAEGADRRFAVGGPGHTVDIQALLRFLFAASHDRRFTAARMLPEMAVHNPLDWLDWQLYSFVLIPKLRLALQLAERELAWMDDKTAWGPGRDDAFNLPKRVLLQQAPDAHVSNTDFPALWRLGARDGQLFHAGGQAATAYAVSATSALGTGALPGSGFRATNEWIVAYLRDLAPPPYPAPIDAGLAARGATLFGPACAACHAGPRTGTSIPVEEIGTDPEHVRTWTAADAAQMNRLTATLGLDEAELRESTGYVAKPLVGVWLLGPYLHNGSVPSLVDLLSPPAARPAVFWRGYDVLDLSRGGFVSTGPAAEAAGFRHDTALRGNGNGGHAYGTELSPEDRAALIEYLKTL